MNFTAYIERQKKLIRERHEGETFLLQRGEVIPVTESDSMIAELTSLKGLNKRERMRFCREAV